jgi:tRNA-modifying protein YgfZ
MESRLYVPLPDRALVAITGDDARPFVQGLVTNDVDRVDAGHARYAALLTPQGRYLFDFFMFDLAGALYLDCEAAGRAALIKRLALYKLRAKAMIAPHDGLAVCAAFGAGALEALGLDGPEGMAREFGGGIAFVDPRDSRIGARVVVPANGEATLKDAGLALGEFAAYDAARLRLGLPDGSRDFIPDRLLLLEGGADALNGVDFGKGCYVGQEVTTRMHRRDLVRKRLMPVSIDGPVPEPGAKIVRKGIEACEMRSAAGKVGMALLRLDLAAGDADQDGPLMSGEARLTPLPVLRKVGETTRSS